MPTSTLIIEDGSCVAGANSYVDFAAFVAFLENQWQGEAALTAAQALSGDQQAQLLMAAAEALACYAWVGVSCSDAELAWPRIVCGSLTLPKAIQRAQMLIAKRMLQQNTDGGDCVTVKSIKLPGGLSATFGDDGACFQLSDDGCGATISNAEAQSSDDTLTCLIAPFLTQARPAVRPVLKRALLCA